MDQGAEAEEQPAAGADWQDIQDVGGEEVDQVGEARGATEPQGVHVVRVRAQQVRGMGEQEQRARGGSLGAPKIPPNCGL